MLLKSKTYSNHAVQGTTKALSSLSSLFTKDPLQSSSLIPKPRVQNPRKPLLLCPNEFEYFVRRQCKSGKITLNDALTYFNKLVTTEPSPLIQTKLNVEGIKANLYTLSILMNSCGQLKQMSSGGFEPDLVTVSILLKVQVFDKMCERGFQGDGVIYGILINGLCFIGHPGMALELHRKMENSSCQGTLLTFSMAASVFSEMVSKQISPDAVVYGRLKEAVNVFDEMVSRGLTPDLIMYNTFIHGFCQVGMWGEAVKIFNRMVENGISPDVVTFTTLIDSLGKEGKTGEAQRIFDLMIRQGAKPDIRTYNSLLSGLCSNGHLDEATKLFGLIVDQGLELDAFSYNIMITFELFQKMHDNVIKPTIVTYNTLIGMLFQEGQVSTAQKMFNEMHVYGQSPALSTYTVMLDGLCKHGHIEEALDLFHSLESTNKKPSIEHFSILIDGMWRAGKSEEARKMFTEISEKGGLCKQSMSLEANKLLMEMEEKGCVPDSISFNTLIHGLLREKEVEKAMNRLEEMRRRNFSADEGVTSLLLRLAMKDKQCRAALESLPDVI
ncbi:hypothetical protein V6Z12_D02G052600 [Gossypium hirsutum]